jgi:hypothetical protein
MKSKDASGLVSGGRTDSPINPSLFGCAKADDKSSSFGSFPCLLSRKSSKFTFDFSVRLPVSLLSSKLVYIIRSSPSKFK